jgi:uncharacterized protein (DUF952 family)
MAESKIIYHITTPALWEKFAFLDFYEAPSLQDEGFIHASKAHQVQETANRYYKDEPEILLLTIDTTLLAVPLVYEEAPKRKEEFPHMYGKLNKEAVIEKAIIKRQDDGYHIDIDEA